jgi:hypothetical protein
MSASRLFYLMVFSLAQSDLDLAAIHADMPEAMTHPVGGTLYSVNRVSMSMINWEQRRREVTEKTRVVISLQISAVVGPAVAPAVNDLLTYDGETMLVLDTGESPEGQELRIFLGDQYAS